MYLMCGPKQLLFFKCGPETPQVWTPLGINIKIDQYPMKAGSYIFRIEFQLYCLYMISKEYLFNPQYITAHQYFVREFNLKMSTAVSHASGLCSMILQRKSPRNNLTLYSSQDSDFSLSIRSAINHQESTYLDYISSVSYRKSSTRLRFTETWVPMLLPFKTYPKEIFQIFACIYLVISLLGSKTIQRLA